MWNLGINIDNDLGFNRHMLNICSKAIKKLAMLNRMFKYLSFEKKSLQDYTLSLNLNIVL